MVRFILDLDPRGHVGQVHLDSVGFLNVRDGVERLRLGHVFDVCNSLGPSCLEQFFAKASDSHSHGAGSGSSLNFFVPRVSGVGSRTFFYQGVLGWSSLPVGMGSITDKSVFKIHVGSCLSTSAMSQGLAECV